MALILNAVLGLVLVSLAVSIFYGFDLGTRFAGWLRGGLQAVLGPDFHMHDWVVAIVALVAGGLALLSAFMILGREHQFWVVG